MSETDQKPDSADDQGCGEKITRTEIYFLPTMDRTVNQYLMKFEQKLEAIKQIELILAGVALVILLLELVFPFSFADAE